MGPRQALLSFHVPGRPMAWERARLDGRGSRRRFFTDPESQAYRDLIAWSARQAWRDRYGKPLVPLDIPLGVRVDVLKPRPQRPKYPVPVGTPDYDNFAKVVGDALNKILWRDDSLICDGQQSKRYAVNDEEIGLVVTVWRVELTEVLVP